MERRDLGGAGLKVTPVCVGTWQLSPRFWGDVPEQEAILAMRRAFDAGVNFYDTADAYGDGHAERVLGKALAPLPRGELVLATKVYWHFHDDGRRFPDLSRAHILEACDASLLRFGMETIDLYQCHSFDPLTPVEETVDAMETLVKAGKIRAYGVSNWTVEQIRQGRAAGGRFATCQPFYSLLQRDIENDLLPYCAANDIGTLVYSPLHRGLLTGKYRGTETFEDHRARHPDFQGDRFRKLCGQVEELRPVADAYRMTTVQLVLAVTLMHPAVDCAIVGTKRAADIEEAAGAAGKRVSSEDYHKVRGILRG